MGTGRPRDERRERQWRRWLREWRGSALSVRAFCAQRGLSEHGFYAWRRELKKREAERSTFVPVHVVAGDVPANGSVLEVVLPGGRAVRVAPGFDAATLRQLLAVLEEGQRC